ncbi:hypothetical protein ACO0QE_000568 [Hanseniaspora vineae]
MGSKKRSQQIIQDRAAKRRKEADSLLSPGAFSLEAGLNAGDKELVLNEEASTAKTRRSKNATWDDEEQDYEIKPRTLKYSQEDEMVEGLPIKINGKIERNVHKRQLSIAQKEKLAQKEKEEQERASAEEQARVQAQIKQQEKEAEANEKEEEEEAEEEDTEERILALKEDIANLVEQIMEDPEESIGALTRLRKMAESKNPNTCKFSMLALVPVFRSIIPGYRIRPLTEAEKKEKVTKEVAKLRRFEENLVANYIGYVDILTKLTKTPNNDHVIKVQLGNLAANAAAELAGNFFEFNYRKELFTLVIHRVCKPNPSVDPAYPKLVKTLETLLYDDDEGNVTVEILRILTKTLKVRNYTVDEAVLNILLSMDILDDYDPYVETQEKVKMKKKDRVHLSKKQRKARKEMKQIDEEMRKAELAVSAEQREKNQAEILKLTLALYLQILKANVSKLIGSVLEGLAKFGHMSNFDLLGDFLEVMKELINESDLDTLSPLEVRKVLLCTVTAFSLVGSHTHMKFSMDLSYFVDSLYAILPYLSLDADVEFSHKTLRLADPLNNELIKPSINVSTKAELLLKALDHIFFRSKSGTRQRASAFTKRLYMCALHTPEKTSVAIVKFMDKLMNKYPEVAGLYSTDERIGNGNFNMVTNEVERSNPNAATLWETVLLTKHYSPIVNKGVRGLMHKSRDQK